jgi:ABC-type nickel/cobalt efflux system permease component RcnA
MGWLKNSSGEPDAMLTFAALSFAVTSLCVLLSMVESTSLGNFDLDLKSPDMMLVSTYLATCFTSYVIRRNKKDQIVADSEVVEITEEK